MNFTFYSPNRLLTTDAMHLEYWSGGSGYFTGSSNSFSNLIDRTSTVQFAHTIPSFSNAASFVLLKATLSSSSVISEMQFKNINLKNIAIAINGGTVSLGALNGGTITSEWNNLSADNLIIEFGSITASTIQIQVFSVTSADRIIRMGEWIVGDKILRLPRNPNASGYDPNIAEQKMEIKTIDGGSVVYNQTAKFQAKAKLEWVDQSTTMIDLKGLYDQTESFYFTPYPTVSAWYGESYECNWVGTFDFLQNKYNYRGTPYYAGTMQMKETPL
jgi:hypothetical protein